METLEKFKKQLVYENNKQIEQAIKSLNESAKEVDKSFEEIGKAMGRELTNQDKTILIQDGMDWILDTLRENYPHPNADDEMNLRLMGINLDGMPQKIKIIQFHIRHTGIVLDEKGEAKITEEIIKETKEKNRHYTKSVKQNQALELAKRICKSLNSEMPLLTEMMFGPWSSKAKAESIAEQMDFIEVETSGETLMFVPNVKSILNK